MVELRGDSSWVLLSVKSGDQVRESPEVHCSSIIGEERDNPIYLTDDVIIAIFEDYSNEDVDAHDDLTDDE